jgi:hypothetical protein
MSDSINMQVPIIPRPELVSILLPSVRACPTQIFMMNGCQIIVSLEPHGFHLSISRRDRLPNYGELVTARYRLLPEHIEMAMFFPPLSEFVNLHPHTLHLYQTR